MALPLRPADPRCRVTRPLRVLKFGGTSLATPERLRRASALTLCAAREHRIVVVASALGGVTDRLAALADRHTTSGRADYAEELAALARRHQEAAEALLPPAARAAYDRELHHHLLVLARSLTALTAQGDVPWLRDRILATGERLSAPLLAATLDTAGADARAADASELIVTDATHGEAVVHAEATRRRLRRWHGLLPEEAVPVVTGFIGATPEGVTTALGRSGSDYTAALLAAALEAERLVRWTDVDGLFSADPRTDTSARPLPRLRFSEALCRHDAVGLGMHPRALAPLAEAGVPLHVRSSLRPEGAGTLVVPDAQAFTATRRPCRAAALSTRTALVG